MRALRLLAPRDLRRRWRGTVVLMGLVGVVGALVLASVAGARRSETALARFTRVTRAADVTLLPAFLYRPKLEELDALRHARNVEALASVQSYAIYPVGAPPSLSVVAAVDRSLGTSIDRAVLLAGRDANPNAVDEIAIGATLANQMHLHVGDHIDAGSYSQKQLLYYALRPGPYPLGDGPRVRLRVVGIVRHRLDIGVFASGGGVLALTPAFDRKYEHRIGQYGAIIRVRTTHGASDVPGVLASATRILAKSGPVSTQGVANETQGANGAIDVVTLALRILAAVAATAGTVTIAILLMREAELAGVDNATLRTLGLTTRQRALVSSGRMLVVAFGGGTLAVAGAVALSPRFPVGIARQVDLDRGVHADWPVLAPGAAVLVGVVIAISLFTALRRARRTDDDLVPARGTSPRLLVRTAGLAPTISSGFRFAFERGRGRTAVPVRSACFGAVFGIVGIVAMLVFGSSLGHLESTPRLYGWAWDFSVADNNFSPVASKCNRADLGIGALPGVAALAAVCDDDTRLDGRPVTAWAFTNLKGAIAPQIVSGRAPRHGDEVALGKATLAALHKHIGDSVRGPPRKASFRIVGTVVLPTLAFPQPLADGALLTPTGLRAIYDTNSRGSRNLVAIVAATARPADVIAAASDHAASPLQPSPAHAAVLPVEIHNVRDVAWLPRALAALLGGLALVAVGHALLTGIRSRRGDLAVLKTLGFVRAQVRSVIMWQAIILAAIGIVIGGPIGILVGRLSWQLVADALGVRPVSSVSPLMLAIVPATLCLALVLAIVPARRAANIQPAQTLRID